MKRAVRVLRRAERDLQAIHDLVAREAPLRADSFIEGLLAAIESLQELAERGSAPRDPALRGRGYRFLLHGRHLIFYKVLRAQVRVYRVVDGRRAYRGWL